jgi:carbamoyltransferase
MTSILGISAFYHDSAAALICDGEIVAAAQEERFSRRKHDPGFPRLAIEYCLREAKLHPRDLDAVAFYEKPMVKFERLLETYLAYAPDGFASFREALPLWADLKLDLPGKIQRELGSEFKGKLYFTDHHEAHGASAFFPSPFEHAAILTLDAVGEWSTSSMGVGKGNRIALKQEMKFPHSLGMLYSAFTYYTGFKVNSGEYKLMGLAPYGQPKFADVIREKIVSVKNDGSIWLDMSYFNYCQGLTMTSDKFHDLFGGAPRQPESLITQKEMDLAASIQVVCEEVVLGAGEHVHRETGEKNLVMAGGVALNCVANGRLLREGPFEKIWIQPAAGDAGGALGAALMVWHHVLDKPRQTISPDAQKGSWLGPKFENDDIQLFLDSVGASYDRIEDESSLLERVAGELDEGKVIGWFHGRMEFGPRALGARSIIGDARSPEMQQKMNLKIKYRESFRPFAPCVLHDFAHEIFDMQPGEESPYMLHVAPVRESWRSTLSSEDKKRMEDPDLRVRVSVPRSRLPAITHVDYSARIQTVDPHRHGRYYRLMQKFHQMTGCPVIVNTSFNIRGEPIVGSPEEAFHCFLATEMDVLVLENCVLSKTDQDPASLADAEAYKAQYALD